MNDYKNIISVKCIMKFSDISQKPSNWIPMHYHYLNSYCPLSVVCVRILVLGWAILEAQSATLNSMKLRPEVLQSGHLRQKKSLAPLKGVISPLSTSDITVELWEARLWLWLSTAIPGNPYLLSLHRTPEMSEIEKLAFNVQTFCHFQQSPHHRQWSGERLIFLIYWPVLAGCQPVEIFATFRITLGIQIMVPYRESEVSSKCVSHFVMENNQSSAAQA